VANVAVIGAQWGDEGKGKIVDFLAPHFSIVARYQGGPNAGHTVVFGGVRHALHHIPSGIFHDGVLCLIGGGALVDPDKILEEIDGLRAAGIQPEGRLRISSRAHVILPLHRDLDAAKELRLGAAAIGTTKKGIGPAYGAKVERWGVRLIDLADPPEVADRLQHALDAGLGDWLRVLGAKIPDLGQVERQAAAWWEQLSPFAGSVRHALYGALRSGAPILFEGAQGALLDVDFGTYPFVTSSSTMAGGIPAGLGVPPRAVEKVVGVSKAYATRVGGGPFPTEDTGAVGTALRERGHEFGTTTGRPRRCGWFDAVAMRLAVEVSGLDAIALTKFDVLSGLDPVRLAVAYEIDGERRTEMPLTAKELARAVPVYEDWPGWAEDVRGARRLTDLPPAARGVLDRIAEISGTPVGMVSTGPDREETIVLDGLVQAIVHGRGPL
jgi:adenylosuccinate synthase